MKQSSSLQHTARYCNTLQHCKTLLYFEHFVNASSKVARRRSSCSMVGAVQHLIARCLLRILTEQLLHCGRGECSWLGTPSTASCGLCSIHTGCVMFLIAHPDAQQPNIVGGHRGKQGNQATKNHGRLLWRSLFQSRLRAVLIQIPSRRQK